MKITDLKCAVIGQHPVVRIVTDQGISGHGQIESSKPYAKPQVLFYRDFILGADPTDVERVMLKIRRLGSFKPWGSAVSAIEMALWDLAGKAAGLPVYKLLGGKVRDRVRVYNGGVRFPMNGHSPEAHAESMARMKEAKEGFTIIKQGIGYHSAMPRQVPNFAYGELHTGRNAPNRGPLTEQGLKHVIACVEAMKGVLGDEVGLALDCGPGWMVSDAIRLAKAVEPLNVMWLEDLLTGDYVPYVSADLYREVTRSTSTPIHTGEQIYLRQNFQDLIEKHAVRIIGPDPADIGGIAELKWVAEYADLHGVLMAPHGVLDGIIGWPPWSRCRRPCRRTTSPSSTPWPDRSGGTTSWTGCPIPSSKTASLRSGTGRAWVLPSTSKQRRSAWRTKTKASSTEGGDCPSDR